MSTNISLTKASDMAKPKWGDGGMHSALIGEGYVNVNI